MNLMGVIVLEIIFFKISSLFMYISALSACMSLFPVRHQVSLEMIGSSLVIAGNGTQDLWKSSQLD